MRSNSHTQGGRNTVGGMSAGKGVVLAFVGRRERTKAAKMTISGECFAATGQNLVTRSLMAHIPDNTVVWRIKDVMQCHRKFDHTKSTGEMTGIVGHLLYNLLPELVAHLRQCFDGQSPEVGRKLYL